MSKKRDIQDLIAPILEAGSRENPWHTIPGLEEVVYRSDGETLEKALAVPIQERSGSQTGRLAKVIDAWVANELRRAGFGEDEVWPRLTRPRVLPREVALFVEDLPKGIRSSARRRLLTGTRAAPSDARILGRAYTKQVDVLISQWSRGPELIVSTKSMVSSFRKNLPNRFEEAYGDAKNLRGRHPLAAIGFLFLMRSTALAEPGTLERALDMLRKLRAETDVYDATCLLLTEWQADGKAGEDKSDEAESPQASSTSAPVAMPNPVRLLNEHVPADLQADQFLERLINCVLARTPIEMHVEVRELREHRELPLEESDVLVPDEAEE